ncbi:hypothetical protein JZ751_005850, partial [Albula glossodonta]
MRKMIRRCSPQGGRISLPLARLAEVVGFGVDPTLRINVFDEIKLGDSFSGVSQVQGFHNESRAFLFQGKTG